jgi:chaperonin GroES
MDEEKKSLIEAINLAENMGEEELEKIGVEAKAGFDIDEESVCDLFKAMEEWTKLAKQIAEPKNWPWPKASNIKYPLLSTAAMQFAARAYPSLIPSDGRVVKSKIVGKDPDGTKTKTAEAVSIFMSYQLLDEMEGWEEDMDKLLIMLPVIGTMFKKTYWDPIKEVNCSKIILPKNLIVDYWAKNLRDAERISELVEVNARILQERIQSGVWLDPELKEPTSSEASNYREGSTPSKVDSTTPYLFIEQHTYLDLDKDGYKEPYIVTFHKDTSKVVRIVARYDEEGIKFNDKGDLTRIEPIQYYTKFGFVPNPDGSFYDIGFGVLLGPLNESVNTLINQLVDAGTLNNLQSGFLGKGLRLRMGETKFNPGEWKVVNSTGDDLKKQIVPMPSKEPSKVLFELMGALITSGKELASVAEIFVGKMPGQNTPATTTMATIEQGMKVFTAVYKRIYRSLAEEFQKLYRLNGLYLNPKTYVDIVDMEVGPEDFNDATHRIFPGADPTAISQTEKLMKAQGLMEMLGTGMPLDPLKVMMRILEAQEQPNWQELIPPQIMESGQIPPKPDPKQMEMQMAGQIKQQESQARMAEMQQKSELAARDQQTKEAMARAKDEREAQASQQKLVLEAASAQHKQRISSAEKSQELIQGEQQHQQSLRHTEEQGKAKAEAIKKSATVKKGPTKK